MELCCMALGILRNLYLKYVLLAIIAYICAFYYLKSLKFDE